MSGLKLSPGAWCPEHGLELSNLNASLYDEVRDLGELRLVFLGQARQFENRRVSPLGGAKEFLGC